ncbi:flagellin [Natribacillus halophilus]|uniref:Flagellin n=1 Tax=Natribacillus halophilus TaxID=549003 RepID=A0A1G8KCI5_9BACI|nr:flagellin [Natribacillus halophilus]SDI41118.1 flagellin [Natribacillus halophilus]
MIINNNMSAMNAHRQLGINQNNMQSSMEKLSSGEQINRAGDDAAGLSISEKMRAQIRGLEQASNNAQDGISLIQTAEGALDETHQILQRMSELATQAANDTNQTQDREAIQSEIEELSDEISRISRDTSFNDQQLLNGDFEEGSESLTFHIGANQDENIHLNIEEMSAEELGVNAGAPLVEGGISEIDPEDEDVDILAFTPGDNGTEPTAYQVDGEWYTDVRWEPEANENQGAYVADGEQVSVQVDGDIEAGASATGPASDQDANGGINVTSQSGADSAIADIHNAINEVSQERSDLGAVQNRLEHTITNLDNSAENLQAAESRIRDTDMAQEMMEFTQNNILSEASQAMLAQANQQPQSVLQLLQ